MIVDQLILLIQANVDDLKKKSAEAEQATRKTEEALNRTAAAADHTGSKFLGLGRAIAAFASAGITVGAAFAAIRSSVGYAGELGDSARQLGISTEALDAWGNAVKRTGGSTASFKGSLQGLASHLGTTTNTALKLLPQLADSFQRLGQTRALHYGKMLGLDESTILLLQQGRREVDAMIARQKELGLVTKQDAEIAQKFNFALEDTAHAFRSVFMAVGATVIPVLTKILNFFIPIAQYFRQHSDVIVGALIAIAVAAGIVAIPFIAANLALIATVALVGSAIAIFAILFEDIKAFLNGQSSLIGDLSKKWPILGQVVRQVAQDIKDTLEVLMHPIDAVKKALAEIGAFFSGGGRKLSAFLGIAQDNLGTASQSNLGALTSNSIANSQSSNRSSVVNIDNVSVNTQASDADGIASSISDGLYRQLAQVNNTHANGVFA